MQVGCSGRKLASPSPAMWPVKSKTSSPPTRRCWARRRRNVSKTCARSSMPCAGSCGPGSRGGCCPRTSRRGPPSTGKPSSVYPPYRAHTRDDGNRAGGPRRGGPTGGNPDAPACVTHLRFDRKLNLATHRQCSTGGRRLGKRARVISLRAADEEGVST